MKKCCPRCQENKDSSLFRNGKDGYLYPLCKSCTHKKRYEELKNNPTKYIREMERVRVYSELKRKEIGERIDQIKKEKGCYICKYNKFASSLVFHHINPSEKTKEISVMVVEMKKIEAIREEMDKCVVLCCNCHTALHAGLIGLQTNQ